MIGNKMTLQYKVNKQILERLDDNVVVEKSLNFLYVKFIFSDEWRGLTKYAIFNYVDVDSPYKLEVNKDGIVKVPYDLITFPGFLITVQGISENEIRITTETRMVDVELLRNLKGDDEAAIRYVTSNNNTINIDKNNDKLDLGIATQFEYTPETCTLDLYALTYNTYDDEGQPIEVKTLLSSIVMNSAVVNVEPELNGEGTNRNLIFTFQDGKVIKISIDNFFDEIRQDLAQAVIDLNNRISSEVDVLNTRITNEVVTLNNRIDNEVYTLNQRINNEVNTLNIKINSEVDRLDDRIDDEIENRESEVTRLDSKIDRVNTNLTNRINLTDNNLQDEITRATNTENQIITNHNQEVINRINADNQLQSNIDTTNANLNREIDERKAETKEIGDLIGFQLDNSTGKYIITDNGFIQETRDIADNNDTRLDILDTGIEVNNGDTNIRHNLTVQGDLDVKGTTHTTEQETIQSKATLVVTNSTNAPLVDYTGVVALKGGFTYYEVNASNYVKGAFWYREGNFYVLDESDTYTAGRNYYVPNAEASPVYDKDEDALLIGSGRYIGGQFVFDEEYLEITLTEHSYKPDTYYIRVNNQYVLATGDFDPNATYYVKISQGQHLATRVDSSQLTNGNLLEWNGNEYIIVDSGKSVSDIENELSDLDDKIDQEIADREADIVQVNQDIDDYSFKNITAQQIKDWIKNAEDNTFNIERIWENGRWVLVTTHSDVDNETVEFDENSEANVDNSTLEL